jgi:hypothetical protein
MEVISNANRNVDGTENGGMPISSLPRGAMKKYLS